MKLATNSYHKKLTFPQAELSIDAGSTVEVSDKVAALLAGNVWVVLKDSKQKSALLSTSKPAETTDSHKKTTTERKGRTFSSSNNSNE